MSAPSCPPPAATPAAAAAAAPADNRERFDPAEYALRRRLPPGLPRRTCDVYITNKTAFPAQLDRCLKLLESGQEPFVLLHSLGAAIPRAINLALQVERRLGEGRVRIDTQTETIELTDDFEPLRSDRSFASQSRNNSAVHIKITLT